METLQTLTTLVTIVSIVFGILNLILFFKIWGMTDNVKEILNVIKHDKNIQDDVVHCRMKKKIHMKFLPLQPDKFNKTIRNEMRKMPNK